MLQPTGDMTATGEAIITGELMATGQAEVQSIQAMRDGGMDRRLAGSPLCLLAV